MTEVPVEAGVASAGATGPRPAGASCGGVVPRNADRCAGMPS